MFFDPHHIWSPLFRFDKELGGLEISMRLRDHMAKYFNEHKKTKADLYSNRRAMAKLLKEAKRVKKVLSANVEHSAQVILCHGFTVLVGFSVGASFL